MSPKKKLDKEAIAKRYSGIHKQEAKDEIVSLNCGHTIPKQ